MIDVRQENGYYKWDFSNIQLIVDELKNNHFDIQLSQYQRKIQDAISCRYSQIAIPIIRGDFQYTLVLSYNHYDVKKQKIVFEPLRENSNCVGVIFDINKVLEYYAKWEKRNKQKTVRENVSSFKGPLVLSYIRGTLEGAGIEYTEDKSWHGHMFKTETYSLVYSETPPGELAKLNMERVLLRLSINGGRINNIDVPLKKFVENPDDYISKLDEILKTKETAYNKIRNLSSKYSSEIEKMKTQLTVDLKAVSHARFWWQNQLGDTRKTKPTRDSVNGYEVEWENLAPSHPRYPAEKLWERAKRLGLFDRWTPHCSLQLRNNHSLSFTGDKAKQMWASYNAHIHGKSKKGKK